MNLTRWNPARDMAALEVDRLNRMFDAVFSGEPGASMSSSAWVPAVDIYETADKDVVVKVEVPDMKREDIKVTFENNVLTLEGERAFEKETPREQYHRLERSYGAFRRSFTMPATVDASRVEANYPEGVLTVRLPRREESLPRQVKIG